MDRLFATKSEDVVLIVYAINFQDFQPMWSQSTNVTDRWRNRRTTCDPKTAHCTKVHCVVINNTEKMHARRIDTTAAMPKCTYSCRQTTRYTRRLQNVLTARVKVTLPFCRTTFNMADRHYTSTTPASWRHSLWRQQAATGKSTSPVTLSAFFLHITYFNSSLPRSLLYTRISGGTRVCGARSKRSSCRPSLPKVPADYRVRGAPQRAFGWIWIWCSLNVTEHLWWSDSEGCKAFKWPHCTGRNFLSSLKCRPLESAAGGACCLPPPAATDEDRLCWIFDWCACL